MSETVLVIDDDASLCRGMESTLVKAGYQVLAAISAQAGLYLFQQHRPALVIAEVQMHEMTGFKLLNEIRKLDQSVQFVFVSSYSSIGDAVAAIKAGAYDYLPKPISNTNLLMTIKKALEYRRTKEWGIEINIIGQSAVMQSLTWKIIKVANSKASVLLCGESGTGKEVVARAIHQHSERTAQPFVAINCAAIPKDLLESELFGHAKGSFTNADKKRKGKFSLANKGTLFLDEIGELPLNLQPKLLRALQERVIEPVGGTPEPVDVRIIAATNRDIETAIAHGRFREDLYYRLAVIPVLLPPLRERKEDIPLLIDFFLKRLNNGPAVQFTDEALETLMNYAWPGNVRQLENVIEQIDVLRTGDLIKVEDLPPQIAQSNLFGNSILKLPETGYPLDNLEKEAIIQALYLCKGNKSKTAKMLHITRHALNYRMEKHNLQAVQKRNCSLTSQRHLSDL